MMCKRSLMLPLAFELRVRNIARHEKLVDLSERSARLVRRSNELAARSKRLKQRLGLLCFASTARRAVALQSLPDRSGRETPTAETQEEEPGAAISPAL
jgi:predicted methyltransferase